MGMDWNIVATGITLLILGCRSKSGEAIYFSESGNVTLTLEIWPQDNSTIRIFNAILDSDDSGLVHYSLIASKSTQKYCPVLSIHPQTGQVSFMTSVNSTPNNSGIGTNCKYKVTAELKGPIDGVRNKAKDVIWLQLTMLGSKLQCDQLSPEMICFEGVDKIQLQLRENNNEKSHILTTVGYLGQRCQKNLPQRNYFISSNTSSVVLVEKEVNGLSSLWSSKELDRETEPYHEFNLECELRTEKGESFKRSIPGRLTVLDENDSPVESQNGSKLLTVHISLTKDGNTYEPGARLNPSNHGILLAKDNDTFDVNHFEMKSLNDTKKLLNFGLKSHPIENHLNNNIQYSLVYPTIKLSENVKQIRPWEGDYCVEADIIDTKMIKSNLHSPMRYIICVNWGEEKVKDQHVELVKDVHLEYSGPAAFTLSRNVNPLAPVMFPFPDLVVDKIHVNTDTTFSIESIVPFDDRNITVLDNKISNNDEEKAFSITQHSGIIYVVNVTNIMNEKIKGFHIMLGWSSRNGTLSTATITIHLNSSKDVEFCKWQNCAEHSDKESCESSCSFGSTGNCSWKTDAYMVPGKSDIGNFSTCSPNLGTCPDGKCDELEWDQPYLCPQDCAKQLNGLGRLRQHANGEKYGVEYSTGVCTCHVTSSLESICSCAPPVTGSIHPTDGHRNNNIDMNYNQLSKDHSIENAIDTHKHKVDRQTVSYKTEDGPRSIFETSESNGQKCGTTCIVLYSSISIVITASLSIILILIRWRKMTNKNRKSSTVEVDVTDVELSNGYGGNRTLGPDSDFNITSGLNGNHSTGLFATNAHFLDEPMFQAEGKWEIPREDLHLDHVLGEGEFGRVLKGVMRSVSGRIHVAVKMLKGDQTTMMEQGSKRVRQEFMAEYSLLKQLDHPNIIKLLGVCTSNGGPPFLVMEYAEFGSLRSFLRKFRRVEKINHNCTSEWCDLGESRQSRNSGDANVFDYAVTPQEVLGFSWQIAKGMAYLSDMKMVHRDLAARNVLVTKTKVCKISDFGLTRDIYVDDAYTKKSKDRVPVKWLAPECLTDELYTSKSDVWAFGVLLWELTTLGASPYPGIQTELLYSLLDSGYRMPQPTNCSNQVYSIMRKCWGKVPINRPTFHELVYELSRLLEDGIEYLKLDIPTVSNPGYDIFNSEATPTTPTTTSTAVTSERPLRRNSSMENLRLIDYEISTSDDFLGSRPTLVFNDRHTYINEPNGNTNGSQDCSGESADNRRRNSSSGYESPITLSTG